MVCCRPKSSGQSQNHPAERARGTGPRRRRHGHGVRVLADERQLHRQFDDAHDDDRHVVHHSCAPVSNASVEIWQCDASGNYSEYPQPGYDGTGQTFLRGVQVTNGAGVATFRTIYPGTGVYAAKGQSTTSNASDNVFSDGTQTEMATLTGDTTSGYTAALTVGVSA
jgi:protocatechuate 3,4-dioxygenase beta subunit